MVRGTSNEVKCDVDLKFPSFAHEVSKIHCLLTKEKLCFLAIVTQLVTAVLSC